MSTTRQSCLPFVRGFWQSLSIAGLAATAVLVCLVQIGAVASENVPHRPYAMWADLPEPGQFLAGIVYQESEAYHIYVNGESENITWHKGGEKYGIDVNQGFIAMQYGINERWALDLNVGATTVGWRYFANGGIESTTGLMDTALGARYQIWNETNAPATWMPTLTFRTGVVLPGTYHKDFPFAPGLHTAALEPEFLARKHVGWAGFGVFADLLYRWNFEPHNHQYITSIGIFQQIKKQWEFDFGYRHLQTLSGGNITFNPADPTSLVYPRDVREINDALDIGFSYTTRKHWRWAFNSRTTLAGNNSDRKFWVGASVDIPLGKKKESVPEQN